MRGSLSELCARPDGITSLVMQGDRRQVADRRKVRRGGRRSGDVERVDDLDVRAIALRRVRTNVRLEHSDPPYRDAASEAGPSRVFISAARRTSD